MKFERSPIYTSVILAGLVSAAPSMAHENNIDNPTKISFRDIGYYDNTQSKNDVCAYNEQGSKIVSFNYMDGKWIDYLPAGRKMLVFTTHVEDKDGIKDVSYYRGNRGSFKRFKKEDNVDITDILPYEWNQHLASSKRGWETDVFKIRVYDWSEGSGFEMLLGKEITKFGKELRTKPRIGEACPKKYE